MLRRTTELTRGGTISEEEDSGTAGTSPRFIIGRRVTDNGFDALFSPRLRSIGRFARARRFRVRAVACLRYTVSLERPLRGDVLIRPLQRTRTR